MKHNQFKHSQYLHIITFVSHYTTYPLCPGRAHHLLWCHSPLIRGLMMLLLLLIIKLLMMMMLLLLLVMVCLGD